MWERARGWRWHQIVWRKTEKHMYRQEDRASLGSWVPTGNCFSQKEKFYDWGADDRASNDWNPPINASLGAEGKVEEKQQPASIFNLLICTVTLEEEEEQHRNLSVPHPNLRYCGDVWKAIRRVTSMIHVTRREATELKVLISAKEFPPFAVVLGTCVLTVHFQRRS